MSYSVLCNNYDRFSKNFTKFFSISQTCFFHDFGFTRPWADKCKEWSFKGLQTCDGQMGSRALCMVTCFEIFACVRWPSKIPSSCGHSLSRWAETSWWALDLQQWCYKWPAAGSTKLHLPSLDYRRGHLIHSQRNTIFQQRRNTLWFLQKGFWIC